MFATSLAGGNRPSSYTLLSASSSIATENNPNGGSGQFEPLERRQQREAEQAKKRGGAQEAAREWSPDPAPGSLIELVYSILEIVWMLLESLKPSALPSNLK